MARFDFNEYMNGTRKYPDFYTRQNQWLAQFGDQDVNTIRTAINAEEFNYTKKPEFTPEQKNVHANQIKDTLEFKVMKYSNEPIENKEDRYNTKLFIVDIANNERKIQDAYDFYDGGYMTVQNKLEKQYNNLKHEADLWTTPHITGMGAMGAMASFGLGFLASLTKIPILTPIGAVIGFAAGIYWAYLETKQKAEDAEKQLPVVANDLAVLKNAVDQDVIDLTQEDMFNIANKPVAN